MIKIINFLSTYVKNISIFLIFITFIGIILPSNKYKNYVSLILGFILVFVMLKPISELINKDKKPLDNLLLQMSLNIDKNLIAKENKFYTDKQNDLILEVYTEQLENQIKLLVSEIKEYSITNVNIIVSENEIDFGELKEIYLNLEQAEEVNKKKLIRIEPIKITPQKKDTKINQAEDKKIIYLKKLLSDFYNLSESNIHILY